MMGDPAEILARIERMIRRVERRDDYGSLLAAGQVVRDRGVLDLPDAWRAQIRRQARADRIKVRTGESGETLWAMLPEAGAKERSAESARYTKAMRTVIPRASDLRHEPVLLLRDGDEALLQCARCEALGYVDIVGGPLLGGTLLEEECLHEEAPKETPLTFFFASRIRPPSGQARPSNPSG